MAEQQLPVWNSKGVEPPANLQRDGWQPGVKPPAQYFDWLFNRAYECLEELQAITEVLETNKANGTDLISLKNTVTQHLDESNPHSETSNRTIKVGPTREFQTIQSALDSIKKNLSGRVINIALDAGYSTAEPVEISAFSNGLLVLAGVEANPANINRVSVSDCTATVSLQYLGITTTDAAFSGIVVARCTNVEVIGITDIGIRDSPGVQAYYVANLFVRSSTLTNKRCAFKLGIAYLTEVYNVFGTVKYVFELAWGAIAYATTNYTGSATISDVYAYDGGRVIK